MKDVKIFSSEEEIFEILGWEYTGDYKKDEPLHDKLWDNGFNLDDWDIGFACKEPFTHTAHDSDDPDAYEWEEPDDDVGWLVNHMDGYCVGYHHCEFAGYHWYTVHHA